MKIGNHQANTLERIKMIKCMEFIARQVNDEDVFEGWLVCGVADGDVEYGDLDVSKDVELIEYYTEDENFEELMQLFLRIMSRANKSGGLFCDYICAENKERK